MEDFRFVVYSLHNIPYWPVSRKSVVHGLKLSDGSKDGEICDGQPRSRNVVVLGQGSML